ncbi:transglycosylase SLT domain-containing protein [Nocardia sp. NPDC088792]|uniref:aggregation-promoting factor C-terminal-like domain-containing protein n=1 Tax=Nocardia sp. NPDC088792 TaxID=3364332 RepID=UPI00381E7FB6
MTSNRPLRTLTLGLLLGALTTATLATGPTAHAEARAGTASEIASYTLPTSLGELGRLFGAAQAFQKPALQTLAHVIVPLDQFAAFDQIITHESGWQIFAINPTSGAYGLAQALPAIKMFSEGPDWMFNPLTQLRWAYRYMNQRYGSPNAAWDFWQAHNWY